MINKELYCIAWHRCAIFKNEKASIGSRGLFGEAERRFDRGTNYTSILALHAKSCNTFMVCYG